MKNGVFVEIQFGNSSTIYRDYYKFHYGFANKLLTLAVLIVPTGSVNIYAESYYGTNETAATDTTIDYTAGTTASVRVHLMIDGRDLTSVKFYVIGARVLSGTTFNMSAATGTVYPCVHLEKTVGTDTFTIHVDESELWIAD